jgi:hypothetical protein
MIRIRAANPQDEPLLDALEREALQSGSIVFRHSHTFGFDAFLSLHGFDHRIWIAEDDGKPCGCIAETLRRVVIDGRECTAYYLGGLRAGKAAPVLTGLRLMGQARDSMEASGCRIADALVVSANTNALEFVESITRRSHRVMRAGESVASMLPPLPFIRRTQSYHVRTAEHEDLPAIVELLRASYSRHYCAPPYSEEWLLGEFDRFPGFGMDCFRVAGRGGRIAACAAFWDQSLARQLHIAGTDRASRIKAALWTMLTRACGGVGVETNGKAVPFIYMRHPAALPGSLDALAGIVRHELSSRNVRRNYTALMTGFHEQDPMRSCLSGLPTVSVRSTVMVTIPKTAPMLTPETYDPSRPYHVDYSLV